MSKPQTPPADHPAWQHSCPYCGAPVGFPCVTSAGVHIETRGYVRHGGFHATRLAKTWVNP